MGELLILARIRIHELDLSIVADYYFDVKAKLGSVKGSRGISVWRHSQDSEGFIVIYEYADLAAAERGLVAISEIRTLAEAQSADYRPADVQRIRISRKIGKRPSQTASTTYLSMSQRIADPGYAPDMVSQIEMVFNELQLMNGYLGSIIGTNDALDEEVVGLVSWASEDSFKASISKGKGANSITLYSRFF